MKRILMAVLVVMIGGAVGVQAQQGKIKNQVVTPKKANTKVTKASTDAGSPTDTAETVSMVSAGANKAYGEVGARRFSIADPIINRYNQRANNAPVNFNGKDVLGMPNSTYGIANGRILLRNTTATTPGTNSGSGAVGSGTTLLGVGTGENAISVNGKSPYAGPWLWGGKQPSLNLAPYKKDSARRGQ